MHREGTETLIKYFFLKNKGFSAPLCVCFVDISGFLALNKKTEAVSRVAR